MADIPVNESTAETVVVVTANGQTTFAFDFLILHPEQLRVVLRPNSGAPEIELSYPTSFTVDGVGNENGGIVTTIGVTTVVNDEFYIWRDTPIERLNDWQPEGDYKAALVNREQDTMFMIMQELDRGIKKGDAATEKLGTEVVLLPDGHSGPQKLPAPSPGRVIGYGSDGSFQALINSAADAELIAEEVRAARDETVDAKDVVVAAEVVAVDAAEAASDDADRSELAAGNAFVNANVYADVATGRAAVADGEQFQVLVGNEYVRYRRDSASTQTEVGRYPSALTVQELASRVGASEPDEIIHAFVDEENRLLAYINQHGEMDLHPTEETRDRVSRVEKNNDEDFLFLILDGNNKVVWGVGADGNPTSGTTTQTNNFGPAPLADVTTTVRVKAFDRVIEKLDLKTTAIGRSNQPTIPINGDGLTHPKMLYIPQGWNGYKYWLAATPTFGVVNNAAYGSAHENPHVWASNDLVTWVEPSGGPLDLPEDGNGSYWSDTHLALDDDGWLYCIYRGQSFSFASGRVIVAKRSRDGVNWSDRIIVESTDGGPLVGANTQASPAIFKNGSRWIYVDILNSSSSFPLPPNNYSETRGVFRRSSLTVASDYEPYDVTQIVNYKTRGWGPTKEPWHIDALQVGNLHLHLVNVGNNGQSYANEIYLAWSGDGWNFDVLPRLDTGVFNIYRSSISLAEVRSGEVDFDVIVARTNGTMDLYKLTLEMD